MRNKIARIYDFANTVSLLFLSVYYTPRVNAE